MGHLTLKKKLTNDGEVNVVDNDMLFLGGNIGLSGEF